MHASNSCAHLPLCTAVTSEAGSALQLLVEMHAGSMTDCRQADKLPELHACNMQCSSVAARLADKHACSVAVLADRVAHW